MLLTVRKKLWTCRKTECRMNEYPIRSNADTTHPFLIYRFKLWSINSGAILRFDCIISKQKSLWVCWKLDIGARCKHSQRMRTGEFVPEVNDIRICRQSSSKWHNIWTHNFATSSVMQQRFVQVCRDLSFTMYLSIPFSLLLSLALHPNWL